MGILTEQPIRLDPLIDQVRAPDRGGIAIFLGLVRDHHQGKGVLGLDYSAYGPMAEAVTGEIVKEVESRGSGVAVVVQHRIGALTIGDTAVAVVAAAAHRGEAFDACRYVIEELKKRVPVWKKEMYVDGTVEWVDPTAAQRHSGKGNA
ncbi:MAG TPA: molybdenum cofactor biosynthesis protein MoaE [Gemmatimonadales bacterium]|nr:molybdenum cofactor biosynthesis protein MoaE [Gemmatimonadales bacterium]